ncbi:hypothetical protein [Citrobacter portucalensis]|uniref:hypothetical protein n=1 Tax=Citrobacter portucalensis TaxID=1639133 RepID=UPI00226B7F95|nr:hypothetical protein [Citrobacter portucalensis]MCX8985948.1 hypothetical protein [Citrobacter portucalensis]
MATTTVTAGFTPANYPRNSDIPVADANTLVDNNLHTSSITAVFAQLVKAADGAIQHEIDANTVNGILSLSTAESLNMQKLMGDQSIAAQAGTSSLKSIKDSISGAVRNIA